MPRRKEPIKLLEAKGKTHITKGEIAEREAAEISAPADNIAPPAFLTKAQKTRFSELSRELRRVGILSNLDTDILGIYIQSFEKYKKYNIMVNRVMKLIKDLPTFEEFGDSLASAENLRDRAIRQCRACAGDLGLTITSRCKLAVPQGPSAPPKNPFIEKYG